LGVEKDDLSGSRRREVGCRGRFKLLSPMAVHTKIIRADERKGLTADNSTPTTQSGLLCVTSLRVF
jgi:hypothetical protein